MFGFLWGVLSPGDCFTVPGELQGFPLADLQMGASEVSEQKAFTIGSAPVGHLGDCSYHIQPLTRITQLLTFCSQALFKLPSLSFSESHLQFYLHSFLLSYTRDLDSSTKEVQAGKEESSSERAQKTSCWSVKDLIRRETTMNFCKVLSYLTGMNHSQIPEDTGSKRKRGEKKSVNCTGKIVLTHTHAKVMNINTTESACKLDLLCI